MADLVKFDEQAKIASVQGALGLRAQIEQVVDAIFEQGYHNICWLGIGGTWASAMQATVHMKERSACEVWAENAAEYLTTGNRRIGTGTVVITSSVTGSTQEVVDAVRKAREAGAIVIGFIDRPETELARMVDHLISYDENEQLKFFMVADRFMKNAGEFDEYDEQYAEFDAHLARALVEVEKRADAFAAEFASKHAEDPIHYFVGAGNQWGATYSYAMCYWEEQLWRKTKSITSGEFFHGMFEIVTKETPVTVYIGEDAQRPLSERVARFLPRITANSTVIDTRDYPLEGISERFRGNISHLVMHAVNNRIDVHMEIETRHPMEIRRYYRQLDY
ncbi:SIS domain-containing protein [Collinsella sp. AGMB00827]|uniref:SIS domain-containing protein n=1 Tax=Collinsella ureilytica TaxID=2869515 RepID=A0ABS7MKI2_9ACTN|nr:SIS domain-containing protein [Collinsella urealyticum]MBY4797879.1 SIS domain-containing protein [Collinsella urealyticum]